jgi:hypothetical protein
MKRNPKVTSALKNAALACASVVAALLLGEGALRLMGFSFPLFWQPDPVTGSALRPGVEGWQREEGLAYVRINRQGLRDREHELAKPQGVYRIAILGDSYAEALQVDVERTFWWLLPRRLEGCGFAAGRQVETLNFGVSTYGTAQELLTLRERVWQYSPDMVLLAFFPGNDVRNNSRALENLKDHPYFSVQDGRLVLDASFRDDPEFRNRRRVTALRAPLHRLRLYQVVRRVRAGDLSKHTHSHNAPIAAALAAGEEARPALVESGLDENVFRAPSDPAWREAWEITDKLVVAVSEETRAHRARFLLVVLSTPGTVYPDPRMRARYAARLRVDTLFYPEERLHRLGAQHGFETLALGPEMQRRAEATRVFLHGFKNTTPGFGHWNENGHALAAELIAARLCQSK